MRSAKRSTTNRPLISLSNISIQYRLPLFISALIIIVIILFAGASYYGIRKSSLELGYERLNTLSTQFVSSLGASNERNRAALFEQAQNILIKDFLLSRGRLSNEDLADILNKHLQQSDSLLLTVQLLDKNKNPVFTSLQKTNIRIDRDSVLYLAQQKPLYSANGKFFAVNDSIVWQLAAAVKEGDEIIGYLYKLKLLQISERTLETFAELLGANTTFYFTNDDGSLWTNLKTLVKPPLFDIKNRDIIDYTNNKGEEVIAKFADIEGVPWSLLIERSKKATVAPANRFLEIIAAIGVILLVGGVFIGWLMSRNITAPLNNLSIAASDISEGNYSSLVSVNRKDELGKLAESFNTMALKVRNSQENLERKVQLRTSELKKANEELEELNKKLKELDELKTNFFTNVSHELRTPLALIMGPVEKLLSQKEFSHKAEKDLRVIQQNARILLKQVNNLLDLSRLEAGKMEIDYTEVNLAKLVRVIASYFETMALEKGIILKVNAPDSLFVQADPDKIERVIINLLSNAFKFTPERGIINCLLTTENSNVLFKIEDSGPGVKPELQKAIFSRYSKTDKGLSRHLGSTGLGLSIVKEFIELHRGKIEVKNKETGGAVFSFSIPLTAPERTIIQGTMIIKEEEVKDYVESLDVLKKESSKYEGEKIYELKALSKVSGQEGLPTILIIEDNLDMNSFIYQTLTKDYNVISALNGEEGYEKAFQYKPDLIITDIMMPRLSGDMVVRKIKSTLNLKIHLL
jgi:signal transduction histidine kinase